MRLKRLKINDKRGRVWPIFKNNLKWDFRVAVGDSRCLHRDKSKQIIMFIKYRCFLLHTHPLVTQLPRYHWKKFINTVHPSFSVVQAILYFLNLGESRALFVLFSSFFSFQHQLQFQFQHNNLKWCAWDSNPWLQ